MNLLLLHPHEVDDGRAWIRVDRYAARAEQWPPTIGRVLRVGLRDGEIGRGTVGAIENGWITLELHLGEAPPPPLPLTLLLALPRPKMLRRVLRSVTELGIKNIYLLNSARVEKSYWQSPLLAPDRLDTYLVAGLEQCIDTQLPRIALQRRFRPFVEDELPALATGSTCLVAHPAAKAGVPRAAAAAITLAIGPEGGFTDFEIDLLVRAGFAACSPGPRVLRVETAVPALVSMLAMS